MKNLTAIFVLSVLAAGCTTSSRAPSQSNDLATRDGRQVEVPGLRISYKPPVCESPRKNLDECAQPDEEKLFAEITKISFGFQHAQNPASEKVSQRDFHARHHACLAGTWRPIRGLPRDLRVGAFALEDAVPAVIRYSNGSPKSPAGNGLTAPDAKPDARGLAIKLVGVRGESILDVEDAERGVMNQDFVLINHPAFFLRTPKSYPDFLSLITQGKTFFHIMDPVELGVLKATNRTVADVSAETFFSQTPYALGNKVTKYKVRPCKKETPAPITEAETADPHFLRARIAAKLKEASMCLIFSVQERSPDMDVEDAAVEWKNDKFVDVATISIPRGQDINDPKRDAFCENISFNPWNSLAEHRPAGSINRARLAVYTAISRKRRLENQVPIREPKADDAFFKVRK